MTRIVSSRTDVSDMQHGGKAPTRADIARPAGTSGAVVSYVIDVGPRSAAPSAGGRVERALAEFGQTVEDSL
jgi:hypothetical protein